MTRIFFTADYHLDHANIIRFCNRPFIHEGDIDPSTNYWISNEIMDARKQEMSLTIVKNHNRVIKEEDIVYDLGDFCFKSTGGAKYWEQQLNGTIVHIRGNHDKNNSVKSCITNAILEFGGCKIYATHTPPDPDQKDTIECNLIDLCDFLLCGHVHGLWKHTMIRNKMCINVGVDVWNFEPVSIHSILKYLAKTKRCDLK